MMTATVEFRSPTAAVVAAGDFHTETQETRIMIMMMVVQRVRIFVVTHCYFCCHYCYAPGNNENLIVTETMSGAV